MIPIVAEYKFSDGRADPAPRDQSANRSAFRHTSRTDRPGALIEPDLEPDLGVALDRVLATCEGSGVQVAVALYPGVSADECEAFTVVFDQLAGAEVITVGSRIGHVDGPGGGHHIAARFDEVEHPDVVLVPGGLGCARAAGDTELLDWLRSVAPRCAWLAASSTGTVIVAAAGLVRDREVATHWLASELLESFGSAASSESIVQVGNIITCKGAVTAMHVALLVTLRLAGPEAVADVRSAIESGLQPPAPPQRKWRRRRTTGRSQLRRPPNRELVAPDVIELEPLTFL